MKQVGDSGNQDYEYLMNIQQSYLRQSSTNPIVYTKLSCYLPWIAEQYNMEISTDMINSATSKECLTGTGVQETPTSKTCKTVPDMQTGRYLGVDLFPASYEDSETECIFPFIFNGTTYTSCALYNVDGLTFPVFMCPVRTIKNQYTSDGTPWYTAEDLITLGISTSLALMYKASI